MTREASKTELTADDIVRIKQSTLIGLNRDARQLPLNSASIRAQFNGQYLSTFKGRGMEFDESRPYQPGDDIRSMDWKVTARTGKAHSKVFREERERPVLLWVDYRQPMFFGTQQHFKSVLAAKISALLAWSTAHHGDRLGGLIFSESSHIELRPSRGKSASLHFIKQLAQHTAWDNSLNTHEHSKSAADALARLQRVNKPGSLIFLISDFRNMDDLSWSQISRLNHHSDIILISIHDPLEQQLPPAGNYKISNGETELNLNTYNKKQRKEYQNRFLNQQLELQNTCRKQGMHYLSVSTIDDVLPTLQQKLGISPIAGKNRVRRK
ncbi:MAG: DUF58 domain-containing protein [endosymbiont of Galathealinum brachiosum]|uniref:DUF58 domain-containing protein n=1 Tax=endosymbiont of Galathealinum brachiosum TaxID=2200906 RepID=A0A370D9M3_9GAMM|nr:MAG: DUF58 domain-containing protein [endosymbiont of Galathealinum brachiosum]